MSATKHEKPKAAQRQWLSYITNVAQLIVLILLIRYVGIWKFIMYSSTALVLYVPIAAILFIAAYAITGN
jgi:hypothetical protein